MLGIATSSSFVAAARNVTRRILPLLPRGGDERRCPASTCSSRSSGTPSSSSSSPPAAAAALLLMTTMASLAGGMGTASSSSSSDDDGYFGGRGSAMAEAGRTTDRPDEDDHRVGGGGSDVDVATTTRIVNWSGTHAVELSNDDYREPETSRELSHLVDDAYRSGYHVRPVGSALSPNGLSFDPRGMVCLSNLDRVLGVDARIMTATVEAGTRVSSVLDALRPHGLTLPNLASIAEQQVGGFVSAGAHGTGAAIPPVDEFVVGLTMITPSRFGTLRMTEESHGEAFRLARLGLGGLGILSEVTLKAIPSHRLVERTTVVTRAEAREGLPTLLKRHRHVRYMWIPYEDAVVIVTNDPEDDLPLAMEGGVVVDDGGKGGGKKRKVVTAEDVAPRYSREERLAPMRDLLRSILENQRGTTSSSSAAAAAALDDETIDGMGFGDLRDVVLASGNMLDPDHIRRVNRAEKEFWIKSQGMEIAPSDEKLQFDCGGQQWVYEVCFPAGTYGIPNSNSIDFVTELLAEIESRGIAAPSPIEQRWTSASTSPLSPAYAGSRESGSYDAKYALFSWVGVIMYLPSDDLDPTGYRREFITRSFKDGYCKMVREVGSKYGAMCHWAKLELGDDDGDGVAEGVRERLGPRVVGAYNAARATYDPNGVLSCSLIDRIFGPSPSNE